jgi:anti-sigma B factor antagonist
LAQTEWTGTVRRRLHAVPGRVDPSAQLATPVVDVRVRFPLDGVCVLDVNGDIDMLTAPVLDSMVTRQIESRPNSLILDLRGVDFMSSAGLASLMAARDAARKAGIRFRLVCTGQPVLRPMTVTGLTSVFDIHADLDAALA